VNPICSTLDLSPRRQQQRLHEEDGRGKSIGCKDKKGRRKAATQRCKEEVVEVKLGGARWRDLSAANEER